MHGQQNIKKWRNFIFSTERWSCSYPHHYGVWGNRGIAPLILISELDGGKWSTVSPERFTREKEHRYPLNRRLCGRQIRSGRFGEEKSIGPTVIRTVDHPARSLVTIPTVGGVTMNEDKRRSNQKACPLAHPTVPFGVQADYPGSVCRAN